MRNKSSFTRGLLMFLLISSLIAKLMSLVCVNEILKFGSQLGIREPMMYWPKVKQEIYKL